MYSSRINVEGWNRWADEHKVTSSPLQALLQIVDLENSAGSNSNTKSCEDIFKKTLNARLAMRLHSDFIAQWPLQVLHAKFPQPKKALSP